MRTFLLPDDVSEEWEEIIINMDPDPNAVHPPDKRKPGDTLESVMAEKIAEAVKQKES